MIPPLSAPTFESWRFSDGYVARGRTWNCGARAAASRAPASTTGILYLHGIQSHGGWYEWSASVLAASGSPVVLCDRRGSGLNDAARGDAPSPQRLLQDLDELAAALRERTGVTRVAVVGVSWGGKLAIAWLRRGSAEARRASHLMLIAPGLFPRVDVSPLTKLGIAGALLFGGRWRFEIPLSEPALFTDNPAGQAFIANDHHKLTRATARFLFGSARLDAAVRRTPSRGLRVDVQALLAGQDRIIHSGKTAAWLERSAARSARVEWLDEAGHTLEFEPDRTEFESLLREWSTCFGTDSGDGAGHVR